jgi:radical SAM superfamily enzyme YgiQ (UPF0313 family)
MDFTLVCPTAPEWRVERGSRPRRATRVFRFSMLTGLTVAAALPHHVRARIIDEEVEPVDIDNLPGDLIGFSFMTYNAPRAYELADRLRARGRKVVFGGYHPTFMPDEAEAHADAVCIGEAETVLPEVIADFETGRLKRRYTAPLADLSRLRVPDRRLVRRDAYIVPDSIQATRGCRNRCQFCSITSFFGHTFRTRPVDAVVDELRGLGRSVMFMDDNIIGEPEYARELFAAMVPLGKEWVSQCGVGISRDAGLLQLARRSGCRGLFIGFESINDASLAGWSKSFNRARDYERAVRAMHAAGLAIYGAVVFGSDQDGPDIFRRTLEFLDAARVDALQATILTPFPGTGLHAQLDRQGRIFDRDWSHYNFGNVVFEPARMSREQLRDGHDWVLARFYSPKWIGRRMFRACGHVPGNVVLRGLLPLNLSYRIRLGANRAIRRPGGFRHAPA